MSRTLLANLRAFNRRVYSSLPWGYRLAQVMIHMASGLTETLGKVFYAKFLEAGLEDLPAIDGQPALAVADRYKNKPERLPRGYGAKFGARIYATLLQKSRNPDLVEEVSSQLLVNVARDRFSFSGMTLNKAENFVVASALNLLTDALRAQGGRGKERRKKDLSLNTPITDNSTIEDILNDPSAFKSLDDLLSRSDLNRMVAELDKIYPRSGEWFEAKLRGDKSKEIAEAWGVTPARVSQFETNLEKDPRVREILVKYLDVAA